MSYQVLARKWRPQVFADVVGQSHITKTLQNAITTNRLAHAFLFSGPRGVGKTTTARILAKALNCKEGPTPNPCGVCDPCRETAAGSAVDVIEIDGASNRGIEHIRELRETVRYAPAGGKYKVYVIDEVHMLTNEAFNALLKTLEEPPPHVIFVFATTEPQKIPATIHSRCQRYGFKRVALNDIVERLRTIASAEGITISDAGLAMIARAAEGSMRDSQSLLDQAVSYSGLEVRDGDLQNILGAVPQEVLHRFTGALLGRDAAKLLPMVDELLEQGQDMRQFLAGAVEHLRNLIVIRTAKDPAAIIELPAADLAVLRQQADGADLEQLLMLFDGLARTLDELRWSPHQRFTLEVGLVKACSLGPLKPLGEVLDHLRDLEARIGTGTPVSTAGRTGEQPAAYRAAPPRSVRLSGGKPAAPSGGGEGWSKVIGLVKQRRPSLAPVLEGSNVLERAEDALVIGIRGTAFHLGQVEAKDKRTLIEEAVEEVFGRKFELKFSALGTAAVRPAEGLKPAKKAEKRAPDPLEQDILSIFNGEVIEPEEPQR
jgi:DNA polymerase-3 subunit gamma/tau